MMGIGQQSCIAYPCSASMRWPAKMREAGDAKIEREEQSFQLTASAWTLVFITLIDGK